MAAGVPLSGTGQTQDPREGASLASSAADALAGFIEYTRPPTDAVRKTA